MGGVTVHTKPHHTGRGVLGCRLCRLDVPAHNQGLVTQLDSGTACGRRRWYSQYGHCTAVVVRVPLV